MERSRDVSFNSLFTILDVADASTSDLIRVSVFWRTVLFLVWVWRAVSHVLLEFVNLGLLFVVNVVAFLVVWFSLLEVSIVSTIRPLMDWKWLAVVVGIGVVTLSLLLFIFYPLFQDSTWGWSCYQVYLLFE